MKIKIENTPFETKVFKEEVVYSDDKFLVYEYFDDDIVSIVPKGERTYSIDELPTYIRDIAIKEVI